MCVRSLIIDNTETHDQVTIMRKLNTYYSSLYARKSIKTEKECLDYLANISTPILTNEEQHLCEGQLTPVEVFDALSNMQANKTPGNDGLRACSHEPRTVNYPGVMIVPGQALPRVHMMICCPGATLPLVNFIVPGQVHRHLITTNLSEFL